MDLPIVTERLYITEFDESMAESVYLNSLDEDNRRFIPDEVFESVEKAKSTLNTLVSYYDRNDSPLVFPVFLKDGEHIGHVQVFPVNNGWEIGYHVAKQFTGNGYATEAVNAFLPFAIHRLGLSVIHAVARADNAASRRVLEKCGFTLENEEYAQHHGKKHLICRYSSSASGPSCKKPDENEQD